MLEWLWNLLQKNTHEPVRLNSPPTGINQANLPPIPAEKLTTINLNDAPQIGLVLPNEVLLGILLHLPTKDAANFFISCRLFYMFKENYCGNLLRSFFSEETLTEEAIAQFDRTVARLAGNSELEFASNEERYFFLKKNLIDAVKGTDRRWCILESGCFVNQNFFKIIFQLNAAGLFNKKAYNSLYPIDEKYEGGQKNVLLSLAKIESNSAFRIIVQKTLQGDGKAEFQATYNFLQFFKDELKFHLDCKKLQIIIEEAVKEEMLVDLGLSPLETAIVICGDEEFKSFVGNPKRFQQRIEFGIYPELTQQSLVDSYFKEGDVLLAIHLQAHVKLDHLLQIFGSKITVGNIDAIITAAYKENNLEILECVFKNIPSDILSDGLQRVLPKIIHEKPLVEMFSVFLKKYKQCVTANKWHGVHSNETSYQYIIHLSLIAKTVGKDVKDFLQIQPSFFNILIEDAEEFWTKQPKLEKADMKQQFSGISLLQLAVQVGNKAAIKWLLKNNIDYYDSRVLWDAIANEYLETSDRCGMIKILLTNQKAASKLAKTGNTLRSKRERRSPVSMALAEAIRVPNIEVLKELCSHAKSFPTEQNNIQFAVEVAVARNDLEKINHLLSSNPNLQINLADVLFCYKKNKKAFKDFKFPLDIAVIDRLLNHPMVTLNASSSQLGDALYYAIAMGREDLVSRLLSHKMDPNFFYAFRKHTALTFAIYCGHLHIAILLLKHGADPYPENFTNPFEHGAFIFPLFSIIHAYDNPSYQVGQLNKAIILMLDAMSAAGEKIQKMMNTVKKYHDDNVWYSTTLGVELVYQLIIKKVPEDILDKALVDLSIDLNVFIFSSENKFKSTLLEKIADSNCLDKQVLNILVRRGANLFLPVETNLLPVETNRQWMKTLVDHYIFLEADWLQLAAVGQIHCALQDLVEVRRSLTSEESGRDYKELIIRKSMMEILFHKKFSLQNFKGSVADYIELLGFVALDKDLEILFKNNGVNFAKKIFCFTEHNSKRNVLHYAIETNNRNLLNKLFELQIYPMNIADGEGKTPAHYVATSKDEQTLKAVMMQPGIQLGVPNKKSQTAWQLGKNNYAFVMAAISNPELKSQLDELDSKGCVRLYWQAIAGGEPTKESLALFHQFSKQFDPNEIVKFGENYEAGHGIKPGELFSKEIDIRLGLLKIIKAYMDSDQSFIPNRAIVQFIGNCKEKKFEVANGGIKADMLKEYVELVGELDKKFSQPKASLPFFEKTDAKGAVSSSQKTYISQQKLAEISFRGFQR